MAIEEENQTVATITIQNYFRQYDKLAGMTGTAATEADEFMHIYKMAVVSVPTHKDMIREDKDDLVYKSTKAKHDAVVDDIVERHKEGQPVLVGTVSVEVSEHLAAMLKRRGIGHEVLNAKQHERDRDHRPAGDEGSVTIAKNGPWVRTQVGRRGSGGRGACVIGPSATSPGASTTSCAADQAARATRASRGSTSRSRTTSYDASAGSGCRT